MINDDNKVNLERRRTLKIAGALTAGGAVAATPVAALAGVAIPNTELQHESDLDKPLDEFTVEVQHQWQSNDIALVIRNHGDSTATITQITPSKIELARGTINVGAVLDSGPITLAAGERLTVPLQHHRRNLYNAQAILGGGHFDRSLQKQLRERLSIITDHNSLAAVTVAPGPRVA